MNKEENQNSNLKSKKSIIPNKSYIQGFNHSLKDFLFELISKYLDSFFIDKEYEETKLIIWSDQIVKELIQKLIEYEGYKYSIECFVLQKGSANLHLGNSSFWRNLTDFLIIVQKEFPSMFCLIKLNAISIF